MKTNLLKGRIVAAGYNQKTIATLINMSPNTFGKKINGKTPFNTDEIGKICEVLLISSDQEKIEIFLR